MKLIKLMFVGLFLLTGDAYSKTPPECFVAGRTERYIPSPEGYPVKTYGMIIHGFRWDFDYCKINKIIIPDKFLGEKVLVVTHGAFSRVEVEKVHIGKNVDMISNDAFTGVGMREVVLNDGLRVIKSNAFSRNKIAELVIPSSVEVIQPNAFASNCIRKLTIKGNPRIGEGAFKDNLIESDNSSPGEAKKIPERCL